MSSISAQVADPPQGEELRFVEIFKTPINKTAGCANPSSNYFDDDFSGSSLGPELDDDDPFFRARFLSRSKSVMTGTTPTEADTVASRQCGKLDARRGAPAQRLTSTQSILFSENDLQHGTNILLICKDLRRKQSFDAAPESLTLMLFRRLPRVEERPSN